MAQNGAAARTSRIARTTSETKVAVELGLDGAGEAQVATGVGFFDHMLTAFARHGLFDLRVKVEGDLHIDAHHTVEDTGIALGQAFWEALGDKRGIVRIADACAPLDEALVHAVVDLSGRAYLAHDLVLSGPAIGAFDTQLGEEFWRAFAHNARLTLHVRQLAGRNDHHIVEAAFKAVARALDAASRRDPRVVGVPSTKGTLDV
ncbi:MAG TPA: imidazoleglycerol-phosphate dehydratase HisB [Limnochordia bacterium]|nr:imidazoleglycerol-phosphate dehydratase HisB [Limnochordia bacterium]